MAFDFVGEAMNWMLTAGRGGGEGGGGGGGGEHRWHGAPFAWSIRQDEMVFILGEWVRDLILGVEEEAASLWYAHAKAWCHLIWLCPGVATPLEGDGDALLALH